MLGGAAWAQEGIRRGDFEVGMDIGWTGFGSDLVKPNGSRMSFFGGYFITHGIALQADITCLGGNERAPADNTAFTMCTGSICGALDFRLRASLVPYVRLGVGQAQLDRGAEAGVFDIEERSAALQAGAGSRFYLGKLKRVAVRVDALWTRTVIFDRWSTHASLALGVVYRFVRTR